ncbi:hypothetical protein MUS1_03115 [Marinomonas ushuaiensis DSM 15871]|uniref:Uncharacterized protein n=1 Tax=Marinomonas ushuaiensis DSM 15871 TaxID=1122207 RepID=X7EBW6_9GAMM|nr:hypothetical protein [Marinomonas ushuaiensis]ETX12711.1 hypothetical protein MUS1_03115 [Marinomonas ushuaiensis DSM 15871]
MVTDNYKKYQNPSTLLLYISVDFFMPIALLCLLHFVFSNAPWSLFYTSAALLSVAFFVLGTESQGGYRNFNRYTISKNLQSTFNAWFLNRFLLLLTYFYLESVEFNNATKVITAWIVLTPLLIVLAKFKAYWIFRDKGMKKTHVAVIGNKYQFNEFEFFMLQGKC